jgi:hypothetical protein
MTAVAFGPTSCWSVSPLMAAIALMIPGNHGRGACFVSLAGSGPPPAFFFGHRQIRFWIRPVF